MIGAAYPGEDVVDPLADVQMGEGLPRNDPRPALQAVVRELGAGLLVVPLGTRAR